MSNKLSNRINKSSNQPCSLSNHKHFKNLQQTLLISWLHLKQCNIRLPNHKFSVQMWINLSTFSQQTQIFKMHPPAKPFYHLLINQFNLQCPRLKNLRWPQHHHSNFNLLVNRKLQFFSSNQYGRLSSLKLHLLHLLLHKMRQN